MVPEVRVQAGYQDVSVKIQRTAMEAALAALLCRPSRAPLLVDASFSATSGSAPTRCALSIFFS
jgi:hypothetical protein